MHSLEKRLKPPLQAVRIVGLNGSPHRNGNTVTLMRWVLEGCSGVLRIWQEKGWVRVERSLEARDWPGCPERQVP